MNLDQDWDSIRPSRPLVAAGGGLLRITLLFGSAAVALSLLGASYLDSRVEQRFASDYPPAGIDMMSTGSIGKQNTYTIRRSVLQATPDAVCIIHRDGSLTGAC